MNESGSVRKAEYLLKTLLFDSFISPQVRELAWPSELDRWYQLVFALLAQVFVPPKEDLGMLVSYLGNLGHLQVEKLAQIDLAAGGVDSSAEEAGRILTILQEHGYSEVDARRALTLLSQVACGLEAHYGGKVQRYLRSYGEAILADLPKIFSMTGFSDEEVRHMFAGWLQSVTNMPLSLENQKVEDFCQEHGITCADLYQAADNLDINFSIVDDLVTLAEAREMERTP